MRIRLLPPSKRPNLHHFFAAYLNEDWDLNYGTVRRTIQAFMTFEPAERVGGARQELAELLAAYDEAELQAIAFEEGCGYWPPADGLTYTQWFHKLAQELNPGQRH